MRLFVLALVCGVAVYATLANRRLTSELGAARAELAVACRLDASPTAQPLHQATIGTSTHAQPSYDAGVDSASADGCVCEPCASSDASVIAPDGRHLRTNQELEDWARQHLDRRVAAAFPEQQQGGMSAEQRHDVVRLLMEFRELRQAQLAGGVNDAGGAVLRDELFHKQAQFSQLTGLGIGEFLSAIAAPEPAVATDVLVAEAPAVGEERKRFADETARALGIAEPGSRKVLDDHGRWRER